MKDLDLETERVFVYRGFMKTSFYACLSNYATDEIQYCLLMDGEGKISLHCCDTMRRFLQEVA